MAADQGDVAAINPSMSARALAAKFWDENNEDVEQFFRDASHAAYHSTEKMNASITLTATVSKKVKRGGDVSHVLTVDNRVRIPSEKSSFELVLNGEQLSLI